VPSTSEVADNVGQTGIRGRGRDDGSHGLRRPAV